MKKIYGFAALCAAMTLASCSNNDEPKNAADESEMHTCYMAVSIVAPDGTRAFVDDTNGVPTFEYGTANENKVNTIDFLIFKDNTVVKKVASTDVKVAKDGENWDWTNDANWTNQTNGENVARISNAVVVVRGTADQVIQYNNIMAIVNNSAIMDDITEGTTTLANVQALVKDCGGMGSNKDNFMMTNSVFADATSGKTQVLTSISQGNLKQSEDDAKDNPVSIYVERVLAKVNVDATSYTNLKKKEVSNPNYGTENLYVQIDGMEIANQTPKSYVVKNIEGLYTSNPFANWNNPTRKRSFWAVTAPKSTWGQDASNNDLDYTNHSYNWVNSNTPTKVTGETNTNNNGYNFYVQENVIPNVDVTKTNNASSILLTCHLTTDADGYQTAELVRPFTNGKIMTSAAGVENIINFFNLDQTTDGNKTADGHYKYGYKDDTDENVIHPLAKEDFKFTALNTTTVTDYHLGHLQFKATNKGTTEAPKNVPSTSRNWVKWDDTNNKYVDLTTNDALAEMVTAVNTSLAKSAYQAWYWKDGKCYYFVEIAADDLTSTSDNVKKYGIIRNHMYKLNLTGITGFGVPIADPDRNIIPYNPPTPEIQEWSLAAKMNVLQWALMHQNVSFNNGAN